MDDEPITSSTPETVSVDTGADKESVETLNANFADFWKNEDTKSDAPEAPSDGAAQETRETKQVAPKEVVKREPAEPKTAPVSKEYSDDEIDSMEMPTPMGKARPETESAFREIKTLWKADRAKAYAMRQEVDKLSAALTEAKNNAWTPESKADYEHAASIRRKFDFASDPDFLAKFHEPIRNHFHSLLSEAVDVLPDRQASQEWAKYISENYTPDQLDRNWWLNSVVAKVPDELNRATLLNSVTQLLKMQKERDTEVTRRTNDKSSFDAWINEMRTKYPAYIVSVHDVDLKTERGATESLKVGSVIQRDLTIAASLAGIVKSR